MKSAPFIEIVGVVKAYGADHPLQIDHLSAGQQDRFVISGLDAQGGEMFVHLVCGALLPDEGTIRIGGTATADIKTDQDWLTSLDRFGLVSHRAVLIDSLPTIANLVLPLTLSIDPIPPTSRAEAESVARLVGLAPARLSHPVAGLSPDERLRLHLGRALISRPRMLLLEHPTSSLADGGQRTEFGRLLAAVAAARSVGWIAVSNDDAFAEASRGRHLRIRQGTGALAGERGWWPWRRS